MTTTYEEEYNDHRGFQPPPRKNNTVWIVLAIVGGIMVVGFLVIGILAAMLLPVLSKARERARRVSCASNMKQIGLALIMYSGDNEGNFPPDLKALVDNQYIMEGDVFVCPSSGDVYSGDLESHYIYIPGLVDSVDNPTQTVLLYEKDTNHREGFMNVLFVDGHVEGDDASIYLQMIEQSKVTAQKIQSEKQLQ